jgi:hypothetical protein
MVVLSTEGAGLRCGLARQDLLCDRQAHLLLCLWHASGGTQWVCLNHSPIAQWDVQQRCALLARLCFRGLLCWSREGGSPAHAGPPGAQMCAPDHLEVLMWSPCAHAWVVRSDHKVWHR